MKVAAQLLPDRKISPGTVLRRIFATYRSATKAAPWFFSDTSNNRSGRFDLSAPAGTCYFSDDIAGCWLEVFRATRVVQRTDVDARTVTVITKRQGTMKLADLTSPAAVEAGVTLDQSAGADHHATQALAKNAQQHGLVGVVAWIRHDPAARFRNFALFGKAGAAHKPPGWDTAEEPLAQHVADMTTRLGVRVAGIPHDLPIAQPPTHRGRP